MEMHSRSSYVYLTDVIPSPFSRSLRQLIGLELEGVALSGTIGVAFRYNAFLDSALKASVFMDHDLVLDRLVLLWVFIPLTCAVVLMMLLRQFISKHISLNSEVGKQDSKEIRESQALAKGQKLREQGGWIPQMPFLKRKAQLTTKDSGVLCQKVETRSLPETVATDPTMMVNMLKGQLTGLIPQIMMGTWVNYFFAGFVLGRVPFSLSPRFRPMLQRGIDMQAMDVSYFTGLSYYVLLLFGLRGVFSLFFREDTIDDTMIMRRQMHPMGGMGPGGDIQKAFAAEKDKLDLVSPVIAYT